MLWSQFEHYLKGEHMNGRKLVVTIKQVVMEETHAQGHSEEKPVAYFMEGKKGLILSPTNCRTLRSLFGDDVSAALGKRVQLEAIAMRVAGRDTLPIRISAAPEPQPAAPAARTAAPTASPADQTADEEFTNLISASRRPQAPTA